MSFFENMKISTKIITLLALLGLLVVAATAFMAGRMFDLDARYTSLLSNDAKGAATVLRLNSRVIDVSRLMYLLIAETDPAKMPAIIKELDETSGVFRKLAVEAKQELPRKAGEIDGVLARFDKVLKESEDIKAKALANDNDAALNLMRDHFTGPMDAMRIELRESSIKTFSELDVASDAATAEVHSTVRFAAIAIAAGLAVVMGLAIVMARVYLARPIVAMGEVMHRLADRDYTVHVTGAERKDEIGVMAKAVEVFKDGMQRADEAAVQQERDRAERERRARKIEDLTHEFDQSVSTILGTVANAGAEMQSTASSMSATAEQTTRQATVVASAAEEASTNVQTVAAASEELASSIHEISRQVNQSARVAANAAEQSQHTNELMQSLAQSAQRIGEVVSLINDIASQTNLLALNATIEAARAGEAGKGFAVVAGEVKTLANQTGKATDEIAQQIAAVQAATDQAVEAIRGIGQTIGEINQISTAIASAVEEQGAATQEIARNVQQAATGTQQVTENIGGVSEAATETGHSAHSVLTAATGLARESDSLRRVVDGFLTDVRSV